MKKFANLSWIAVASLLMEVVALIFVTLVLICPAPFESSNLSLLNISPNLDASSSLIAANRTITAPNSTSSTSTPLSTSTSTTSSSALPTTITPLVNNTAAPVPINITTATPAPNPAVTNAVSQAITPSTTVKRELPSEIESLIQARQMHLTQYERLSANQSSMSTNTSNSSSISPVVQAASTILLRVGPLGSCFRTSDNIETCTSAKLQSSYDYNKLQEATYMISDLPSGMTTYPLILLILIIALILKVGLGMVLISVPLAKLPTSITATSSTLQTMANWLVCAVAVTLAVATGIQRNKMSSAANAFNTSNQTLLMDSVPLLAQTDSSFGFIWLSTGLLAVDFFLKRVAIKRDLATDRAKQEILGEMNKNFLPSHYNPTHPQDVKLNPYGDASTHDTRRTSGMDYLRNLIRNDKRVASSNNENINRASSPNPNEIAMSTMILDDYIRRHYRGDHKDDLQDFYDSRSILSIANDHRFQSKESPPFNAYHGSFEKESVLMKQRHNDSIEDLRIGNSSPAPSYWTDRGRQDSASQKEKERLFMAEIRRQRSMI